MERIKEELAFWRLAFSLAWGVTVATIAGVATGSLTDTAIEWAGTVWLIFFGVGLVCLLRLYVLLRRLS